MRDFVINGETLVKVKGGTHCVQYSGNISVFSELGLASEQIRIIPRWFHKEIYTDDFGQEIPVELMSQIADVTIRMPLIHYDPFVLDACLAEGMCGAPGPQAGTLNPAGTIMGNNLPLFASGCHYISLNLLSPVFNLPWRFPTSYLTGPPVDMPIGTGASIPVLSWRAIPYTPMNISQSQGTIGEATSSGRVLWDRKSDT